MSTQGLVYCAQYAFPPNSLGYCGPPKQVNLKEYTKTQIADSGLVEILSKFETLFPYLTLIAHENNIKDPFDPRVVEAYWLGNSLLTSVTQKQLYTHFSETLSLKKKLKQQDFKWLIGKIPQGSLPTHSFHVLNVFIRTGHHSIYHTLETMDNCRIGWGEVVPNSRLKDKDSTSIEVKTEPLVLMNGKLALGKPIVKRINILNSYVMSGYISFHWNNLCDVLTINQIANLKKYTLLAIHLANKTL